MTTVTIGFTYYVKLIACFILYEKRVQVEEYPCKARLP